MKAFMLFLATMFALFSVREMWPQDAARTTTRSTPPLITDLRIRELNTLTPQPINDFARWADASLQKMSERFEVPLPSWEFVERMPNVPPYCGRIVIYKDGTIFVYKKGQLGQEMPIHELRHMLMHGFLHHMEHARGVSFPPLGHEADYDRWLQTLGMWRPQ